MASIETIEQVKERIEELDPAEAREELAEDGLVAAVLAAEGRDALGGAEARVEPHAGAAGEPRG